MERAGGGQLGRQHLAGHLPAPCDSYVAVVAIAAAFGAELLPPLNSGCGTGCSTGWEAGPTTRRRLEADAAGRRHPRPPARPSVSPRLRLGRRARSPPPKRRANAASVQQRLAGRFGGRLWRRNCCAGPGAKVDAPEAFSGPGWKIQEVSRVGAQGVTAKSKLLAREMPNLHTEGLRADPGAARWLKGARAGRRVDRRGSYASV